MKVRWSKAGLVLCAGYGAVAIPLLIYGYSVEGDFKGSYVIRQVAVFPALSLAALVPHRYFFIFPSVMNNFAFFLLLSLLIVYVVGWLFGISFAVFFRGIVALLEKIRKPKADRPAEVTGRFAAAIRYLLAMAFWLGMQ